MGKDVENFNKINYYLTNYYTFSLYLTNRKEIEDFIVDVRFDNPVFAAMSQLVKVASGSRLKLHDLNPDQLYRELQSEIPNIVYKGTYDSIKLLFHLNDEQSNTLATRIALKDISVFTDY